MAKRTQLLESTLASLFVLAVFLVCTSSLQGQAGETVSSGNLPVATPELPPGVPEEYVITPFGYFHASCVGLLAEGDLLLADGRVSHLDGTVDVSAPVCSYPRYSLTGSLVPGSRQMTEACQPGTEWIESIGTTATTGTSYGKITATWTVPPLPTKDNQILYFFPGFQECPSPGSPSILQPVLQYGKSPYMGGDRWVIASWNCCLQNVKTWHSPPQNVSPGDTILGTISSTCKPGGNSCPTWNVVTKDVKTTLTTKLSMTPSEGQVWNWAFGAVLEVKGVKQCSDYPANSSIVFNVQLYDENLKLISSPGWTKNPAASDVTPYCGFDLESTATKEKVEFGPYSITPITTGSADHESPSLNDSGAFVWSQQVSGTCSGGQCWQVFEQLPKGQPQQITSDGHNHTHPAIDNNGNILYLKDREGAGPGLEVVDLVSGVENQIEYSSGNPPGCTEPPAGPPTCTSWRAAGQFFGIGDANAQIVSYHDFCSPSCTRTFDVSGAGTFSALPAGTITLDINSNGDIAYDDGTGTIFEINLTTQTPIKVGSGTLPRINDQGDIVLVAGGQVQVWFHPSYTQHSNVNSTTTAIWADINNAGVVAYEDVDSSGHHQVYQATPPPT